jgi:DNA-directed RNA polymerase specialized sigma24 family protein
MSPAGSITRWIGQLKGGDGAAAAPLWERYRHRLIGLARARLHGRPFLGADEEDVALSAFHSFCREAMAGGFPQLADRKTLLPLLVLITVRKAIDLLVREGRVKRGGGKVRGESALPAAGSATDPPGMNQVACDDLTPDLAATAAAAVQRLLDLLPNENLRQAAQMRLDGYSNDEIAEKFQRSTVAIERWFNIIRQCWRNERPS